jgi:hypothetical protein
VTVEGIDAFSRRLGISLSSARLLAEQGLIEARLVEGQWVFHTHPRRRQTFVSRPLAPKMAWYLRLLMVTRTEAPDMPRQYRARLRGHINQLADSPDPGALLRTWFRHRLNPIRFEFSRGTSSFGDSVSALRGDLRFLPTGVSYFRDGLEEAGTVALEGRCTPVAFRSLVADHGLVESPTGRIWLRRLPNGSRQLRTAKEEALIDLSWHETPEAKVVIQREVTAVVQDIRHRDVLYIRHPGPR